MLFPKYTTINSYYNITCIHYLSPVTMCIRHSFPVTACILNIELVTKQAQRASTLIIEPGIQRRLESQYRQYEIYCVNGLGTRRKQSPLGHDITIKLKHYKSLLDYEITTIIYKKRLKQYNKSKETIQRIN